MDELTVEIDYHNKNLDKICEKTYRFEDYVNMINLELKRIIMDVEEIFYKTYGTKNEWDDDTNMMFQKIRHKLLDQANAIERLPKTLKYNGVPSLQLNEYIANIINNRK